MADSTIEFVGYDRDGHRVFRCPNGNLCSSFEGDLAAARDDVRERWNYANDGGRGERFAWVAEQYPHGPIRRRR